MRISVEKDDPGYAPLEQCINVAVYVNGVECKGCVTADEERGYIKRFKEREDGLCDGETEELHGVEVRVTRLEPEAP